MNNFKGIVNEYPFVAIDCFKEKYFQRDVSAYILSKCHRDDSEGLEDPKFFEMLKSRENVKIYCSSATVCLLKNDDRYKHLFPFIISVEYNEPTPLQISSAVSSEVFEVVVTFMPAGHSVGSAMVLLEGMPGAVLYTGNARIPVGDLQKLKHLHTDTNQVKQLKSLYVDTTFCQPTAYYTQSQADSVTSCTNIIRPWLRKSPTHSVSIQCPAQYGYEHLFRGLYQQLGMKVCVGSETYSKYDGLPEVQDALTPNPNESRIVSCLQGKLEQNLEDDNHDCDSSEDSLSLVLIIKLVATYSEKIMSGTEASSHQGDNLYHVSYSSHPSLQELQELVSYLKPDNIYSTVIGCDNSEQMINWLRTYNVLTEGDDLRHDLAENRKSISSQDVSTGVLPLTDDISGTETEKEYECEHLPNQDNSNSAAPEKTNQDETIELPEDEMLEELLEDETIGELPEDETVGQLPEDETVGELPEDETVGEFPEDDVIEELPEDDVIEELPEDDVIEELPEDDVIEELPEDDVIEELPEDDVIEELPEDEMIEELPEHGTGEVHNNPDDLEMNLHNTCQLTLPHVFQSQASNKNNFCNSGATDNVISPNISNAVNELSPSCSVDENQVSDDCSVESSSQERYFKKTKTGEEMCSTLQDPDISLPMSPSTKANQKHPVIEHNEKQSYILRNDSDDNAITEKFKSYPLVIPEYRVVDNSVSQNEEKSSKWNQKATLGEVVDVCESSVHPESESDLHNGPAISEIPECDQNDCSNGGSGVIAIQDSPKEIDVITYSSGDDNSLLSSCSEIDVETVTRKEADSCIKPIITYPEDDSASADDSIPLDSEAKNTYSTSVLNVNSDNISSLVRVRTELQTHNGPQSIIDLSDDIEVIHEVTVNNHISGVIGSSSQIFHFNILNQGRAPEVFFDAPSSSTSHTVVTSTESNYTVLKRTSSLGECASRNSFKRRHCFAEEYEQACILLDCSQSDMQKITELDVSDNNNCDTHLNITSDSSLSNDSFSNRDTEVQNGGSSNLSFVDSKAQKRKWNDTRSSSEVLCLTSSSSSEDLDVVGNGSSQLDMSDTSSKDFIELIELDDESSSLPKIEANGSMHKESSDEDINVHVLSGFESSKQSSINLLSDSDTTPDNVVSLRDKQNNKCVIPRKIVKEDATSVEVITIDD